MRVDASVEIDERRARWDALRHRVPVSDAVQPQGTGGAVVLHHRGRRAGGALAAGTANRRPIAIIRARPGTNGG